MKNKSNKFSKEIKSVSEQIIKKYNPEKIILFGSCVNGKQNTNSDIDFFIIKNTKKRFVDRIGEVLELCDYSIPIDPLIYNSKEIKERVDIGDPFISEILSSGETLY